MLVILYYLSQNPDFERSVKPLLSELKNSEKALKFLDELSQFSKLFSGLNCKKEGGRDETKPKNEEKSADGGKTETRAQTSSPFTEKSASNGGSQSPISGIADGFIEELLDRYFNHSPQ